MIPLRDSIPASRPPVVTYTLIAMCGLVFLMQLADREGRMADEFGMVPARVFGHAASPLHHTLPVWLTPLTCIFLHGGWLHFLGNMLFLWIFGDNVEDRFGRGRFLLFYLGSGVAASLAHMLSAPTSGLPTVGASGSIAGVMGAYLLLYPRARVQMLLVLGYFVDVVVLPAPLFLGYWFVLQLVQGMVDQGGAGGVAWWAHIGGFAVGAGVAALLRAGERLRPAPREVVLQRRRLGRPRGPRW